MNPQPSENGIHRKVMCVHYGACLDAAIRERWKGFTCEHCRDYAHVMMNPFEWDEDGVRCRALGYAVLHEQAYSASQMGGWVEAVGRLTQREA
jgi:hypothetical protein